MVLDLTSSPTVDDSERARLYQIIQQPPPALYELRDSDGEVGMSSDALGPLFNCVCHLKECGDATCSCNRLNGNTRSRFRKLVVRRTCNALARKGCTSIRYVTLGSGGLLTDFEILCALQQQGAVIESIVAADTVYEPGGEDFDEYLSALRQIAEFFGPARVLAFPSAQAFCAACLKEPHRYGGASALVWCDAADVEPATARESAEVALSFGGNAFALHNEGSRRAAKMHVFFRKRPPLAERLVHMLALMRRTRSSRAQPEQPQPHRVHPCESQLGACGGRCECEAPRATTMRECEV